MVGWLYIALPLGPKSSPLKPGYLCTPHPSGAPPARPTHHGVKDGGRGQPAAWVHEVAPLQGMVIDLQSRWVRSRTARPKQCVSASNLQLGGVRPRAHVWMYARTGGARGMPGCRSCHAHSAAIERRVILAGTAQRAGLAASHERSTRGTRLYLEVLPWGPQASPAS